jgi:hypothetical protein
MLTMRKVKTMGIGFILVIIVVVVFYYCFRAVIVVVVSCSLLELGQLLFLLL